MFELERAWQWREERGVFSAENRAVRVFYGPGEGSGPWKNLAIDFFAEHAWVTHWQSGKKQDLRTEDLKSFLESKGARSAVILFRPEKGTPEEPKVLFGTPPKGPFEVRERRARYWIQLLRTRHPGLFLDHEPLREWLSLRSRGLRVLNTFAYTGSLSVAAGMGGAAHVTTLDMSKPTIRWAQENWSLNGLAADRARFISGDVFEWLPRFKKEKFDIVILDPPSFSHGTKGRFSTAKDLVKLHVLAMQALAEGGILVSSINSANVSWAKFESDILAASKESQRKFKILWKIDLPETFPTPLGIADERYLKGFVLQEMVFEK